MSEAFLRSEIEDRLTALALARPDWRDCLAAVARSFGVRIDEAGDDGAGVIVMNIAPAAIDARPRTRSLNGR